MEHILGELGTCSSLCYHLYNDVVVAVKVEDPKFQKLTLKLMHQKSVGEAECIGTAELPIKEVTSFSSLPWTAFSYIT